MVRVPYPVARGDQTMCAAFGMTHRVPVYELAKPGKTVAAEAGYV